MESFAEYLNENIKGSGIKWSDAATKLNIPYNTLIQWKDGKAIPPGYVQDLIIEKINTWS